MTEISMEIRMIKLWKCKIVSCVTVRETHFNKYNTHLSLIFEEFLKGIDLSKMIRNNNVGIYQNIKF